LKKLLFILALLFAFGVTTVSAQAKGGRKREHKNQRKGGGGGGLFGGVRKHGNSNMFARGGQKTGFFARVIGGKRVTAGGWVYKPTRPGKKQNREQHQLFTRFQTKNKKMKDGMQARINSNRAKNRSHGNANFAKRRY
jgi:hypothetical protein